MANKTTYYVYQLNEKVNKDGYPYIGMTKNLHNRATGWKSELKLNYTPDLIVLHSDTNELRTWEWEQNKRVEYKWPKERSLRHQKKMRKAGQESIKRIKKSSEHIKKVNQNKEHQTYAAKLGGIKGGKIVGELMKNKTRICPYCNKEGKFLSIIGHEAHCKRKNDL